MKIATVRHAGQIRVGVLDPSGETFRPFPVDDQRHALGVLGVLDRDLAALAESAGAPIPLSQLTLLAPIPRPHRNLFCVGKNYRAHAYELARSGVDASAAGEAVPDHPIVFSKLPDCVIGPGQPIRCDPELGTAVDYEVELAVIIGRGGRRIPRSTALEHVLGYTIVNDVTARDLQTRHRQWLLGKSQDTFCPMGPWMVTADEIDLGDTAITCHVNGERRQHANTNLMIFDVPRLIETISAGITLHPGDIIATGTPAGVGIGFDPPRYLEHGDLIRMEIASIGTLENPVECDHPHRTLDLAAMSGRL